MSWRNNLRKAKFRGVEFFVSSHEGTGGRRIINHEYPLREDNETEDLGRKSRDFSIDCYILGDDYFSQRDDLIDALETQGPGELIHPYLGEKSVVCDGFRYREETTRGRIVEFTIHFIEAGISSNTIVTTNATAAIKSHRDNLINAAISNYVETAVVSGVSEFVIDGARLTVQDFGNILDNVQKDGFFSAVGKTQEMIDKAASISRTINKLKNIDDVSISNSQSIAEDIASTIEESYDLVSDASTQVNVLKKFQDIEIEWRDESTSNVVLENNNRKSVQDTVRTISIAEQSRAVQRMSFSSYEDAVNVRNDLVSRIDEQIQTASDAIFPLLKNIRAEVVRAVPAHDESLPRIKNVQFATHQNALLASYKSYGTADKEYEIVERNNASHPGFLPANNNIEVLT